MKPIIFARGNRQRGGEVIALLIAQGATNPRHETGAKGAQCYYIDPNNAINHINLRRAHDFLVLAGQELKLSSYNKE